MKILFLSIGLAVCALPAFAQKAVTITAVSTNESRATNSISIPVGQAARVSALHPRQSAQDGSPTIFGYAYVLKDGSPFELSVGDVVEGPATFVVVGLPGAGPSGVGNGLLTIERWRTMRVIPLR